jgi:hypothetical protein
VNFIEEYLEMHERGRFRVLRCDISKAADEGFRFYVIFGVVLVYICIIHETSVKTKI